MKTPILKLFTSYRRWTKGTNARYKYVPIGQAKAKAADFYTNDAGDSAVCWCLMGAIHKCYPMRATIRRSSDSVHNRLMLVIRKLFPTRSGSLTWFNDHPDTTFADVLKVVRKAKV